MDLKILHSLALLIIGILLFWKYKQIGSWLYSIHWKRTSLVEYKEGGFLNKTYQYAILLGAVLFPIMALFLLTGPISL